MSLIEGGIQNSLILQIINSDASVAIKLESDALVWMIIFGKGRSIVVLFCFFCSVPNFRH